MSENSRNVRSDLFRRLTEAKSAFESIKAMRSLEDRLTPLELHELLPDLDALPGLPGAAPEVSDIVRELRVHPPEPYVQTALAKDVVLYRSGLGGSGKSLIIALCGRSHRMMTSWSLFLQHIPAARFDVLILADRTNNHFNDGIRNYAPDLLSLVNRVKLDARTDLYERVYCFGTSTGGFPALRFGLLADAFRAISISGLFAWPIHRLRSGQHFEAYDPLCACNRERKSHLVCVHAANSKSDQGSAVLLQKVLNVSRVPVENSGNHNIVYDVYLAGKLRNLYSMLFDFPVI